MILSSINKCIVSEFMKFPKRTYGFAKVCLKSRSTLAGGLSLQNSRRFYLCDGQEHRPRLHEASNSSILEESTATRRALPCRDEVIIRRAGPEDEEAVRALGDVYKGRDYLFALYPDLIRDPDTYAIVTELDGKVVGFGMTSTFDGGLTVIKRAGRVAKSHQGQGIFRMIEADLERHTAQERPGVMYETFANSDKQDHLIDRFRNNGYKPVYRKGMIFKSLEPSKFWSPEDDHPLPHLIMDVLEMTRGDLSVLFQAETSQARVFPNGRLFNFYLGYLLQDENIPALVNERDGVYYTLDAIGTNKKIIKDLDKNSNSNPNLENRSCIFSSTNERVSKTKVTASSRRNIGNNSRLDEEQAGRVAMVTFHRSIPTLSGYLYFLDLYATPQFSKSRDHLLRHLQRHLVTARARFPDQVGVLSLAYDLHLSKDAISSTLDELGVRETRTGLESFQVLYEKSRRGSKF